MKILFISHSSPLKEGGAETRTREVALRLARAGHQITILCGKTAAGDPPITEVNGVRIVTRKTLPDFLLRRFPYPHYVALAAANLFLMFYVPAFLRRETFDIVREDVAPFPPTFLLSLVKLPVARRIAITHMLSRDLKGWIKYYGAVFGMAGFLMDRLLRAGRLKYDRIICAARWFADEMKKHPAIARKVRFVPNGVNLEEFKPDRARRNDNGDIRMLSIGRLAETKGHRYAIEALAHLKPEYPHLKLVIVGNGALRMPLINLARELGVADRVDIRPPVAHRDMPALYGEHDFFVMPSIWEGLPVSLIEAMASKLPVVASDIPAITGVLDPQSATFAEKENARDLADKLRWAFEHRHAVRQYADSAYEIARQYDWAVTARMEMDDTADR
jgi:glycosyltransferase involved in cell wall biosynthesis